MKKTGIPLWITLSEIHLQLHLSVGQTEDDVQLNEGNDIPETLEYEISGTGELSRTIEVKLKNQDDSKTTVKRFSELLVIIKAHKKGNKKYSGYFIYSEEYRAFKIYNNQLTLYLDVPDLTFNKFCKEIASNNIHNLSVGIILNGEEANGVGAFGPPNVDDIVSITTDDSRFDSNVKLFSLTANILTGSSMEADKNNEFKP